MKINLNIIVIIILILIPIIFGIKKLISFLVNRKKREKVRNFLDKEPNKKIESAPSKNLKTMNNLMTTKYFANIFYKCYVPVSRYNLNENISIKKYLKIESSEMESNYFFNLSKNRMSNNLLLITEIPKKYWNNFIFPEIAKGLEPNNKQGYPKNVLNIQLIIVGDSLILPAQYFMDDVFLCVLSGSVDIKYIHPSKINELDPMICFPFVRKRLEDIEENIGQYTLREGDLLYLPNGTIFEIKFPISNPNQIIFIIEFDNFQKNGCVDKEMNLIKMEQLQMRKIPRKIYPKDLQQDELELLWINKIVNGNNWEKNQIINNIL